MVEIKHHETGEVLLRVEGDTLEGADLRDANLEKANLVGANLSHANLMRANLQSAVLSGANLTRAKLWYANLTWADLSETNLKEADLFHAELYETWLAGADFSGANLIATDLTGAVMAGAQFAGAVFSETLLGDCRDLHEALHLDEIRHRSASSVDIRTLRSSGSHLPHTFLQGVGYTNDEIENIRAFFATPIQYYSCFLSHAGQDGPFADRLRRDLLNNNVNCWHYRYDMRGGQFWRGQVNEAIKVHDKLVLVCSRHSVKRDNVVDEILQAMDRERRSHQQRLFPVRLDSYILGDRALEFGDEQARKGVWPENWIQYVQRYQIPDFRQWKDPDAYQAEFQKLLRDLKQPAVR